MTAYEAIMSLAILAELLLLWKSERVLRWRPDVAVRNWRWRLLSAKMTFSLKWPSRAGAILAVALTAELFVQTGSAYADTPFSSFAWPGTGSPTSRTAPDRVADIFNVKEYGALGNGSHDDSDNIQAAVTAASNKGIIFFPKGGYKTTKPITVPSGSSLIFRGEGDGSAISGNFNGFIFDNLSSPYNAAGGVSAIEQLNIQNPYAGNNFAVTANGTWSSSGSPVSITLSGENPGIAAGGALFINDARVSTNSVFVGMITSVASYPTVTVSSAAIGSGAPSDLALRVVQCYAAGASWGGGATTITMATTPPAGIGAGQYYIYDYEYVLSDRKTNFNLGVGTWSGTTLTLTPGTTAVAPSIGSADRIWFAPVAGCIRYSSVVGATVRNCTLSGFIGVTSSEDKIVANDSTLGAAEGFHITVEKCNFSNPTGCSAVVGQTGIYLQNNSQAYNNNFNSMWCAIRLSGTANSIIGGRAEVGYFGFILAGDDTATNNSNIESVIATFSMESNLLGIYVGSTALTNINAVGMACNAVNPIGGMYFNSIGNSVVQNSGATGNFGTGYAIFIADPGNTAGTTAFIGCTATNFSTPSQAWRIPAQAWWGTCTQCDNPALEYTFANLPTGAGCPTSCTSPMPKQGETYDISDCSTSTFLATAAGGGSGAAAHRRVRYNATSTVWQVVG